MDPEEKAFRKAELEETRNHNRKTIYTAMAIAIVSNLVVGGAAVATLRTTSTQFELSMRATATQYELSSRATEYNDIIQGLSSEVGAVEINSTRRLQTFIEDRGNFEDVDRQQAEATNAIQTLVAYVKENNSFTDDGLAEYTSSHPPVVPPAISRLRDLASNPSLGENSVDLSRLDMHGLINLRGFSPRGEDAFLPSVDLRGADLTEIDLTGVDRSNLRRSFLTCADLSNSDLGGTDLEFADLGGADLSDADLSHVRGLTSEQLTGVTTNNGTHLPDGVEVPTEESWDNSLCLQYMGEMTGFLPGTGYDSDIECPPTLPACLARS